MEFATAEQTAKRLHVTTRAVQKWAKEGKIPGASQHGRAWLIPINFSGPVEQSLPVATNKKSFLMISRGFVPGECEAYIQSIADEAERNMAMAEYFYFSGNVEEAAKITELYLEHEDLRIALPAAGCYVMSNIILNKIHLSHLGLELVNKNIERALQQSNQPNLIMDAFFAAQTAGNFSDFSLEPFPSIESLIAQLHGGMKLYAFYLLAQKAYAQKQYERVLGIIDTAMLFYEKSYPIAAIYLKLLKSGAHMHLRQVEEAKTVFLKAWEMAKLDHLILPFSRLHDAMSGLLDSCLKRDYPEDYKKIMQITNRFSNAKKLMLADTENGMLHLTPTEFTIAMLANRGWVVKEIAAHIDLSERMVKHHLSVVYEKLGVTSREELRNYMAQ